MNKFALSVFMAFSCAAAAQTYAPVRPIQVGGFGRLVEYRHPIVAGTPFNCMEMVVLSEGMLSGTDVEAAGRANSLRAHYENYGHTQVADELKAGSVTLCSTAKALASEIKRLPNGLTGFYNAAGSLFYEMSRGNGETWPECEVGLRNFEHLKAALDVCN